MHICFLKHLFHLQLCKYNEDDQPVYNDIGDQRDVHCDISDGKVALIYPIGYACHTLQLECTSEYLRTSKVIDLHSTARFLQI